MGSIQFFSSWLMFFFLNRKQNFFLEFKVYYKGLSCLSMYYDGEFSIWKDIPEWKLTNLEDFSKSQFVEKSSQNSQKLLSF